MGQSKPILLVVSALTILGCSGNDTGNYSPFSADGAIQSGDALPPPQVDGGAQPGPDSAPKQPLQASCYPLQEASCPAGQRCGLTTSGAASCFYSAPDDAKSGASCGAAGGGDNCVDSHVCLSASASQTMCARICASFLQPLPTQCVS